MSSAATDTRARGPVRDPAGRFVLIALAWLIGLFAVLRTPWLQQGVLGPFARLQQRVTAELFGAPTSGVIIDASCSGGDAMALCLGVMLAFPATWRQRLRGVSLGFLLIGGLNLVRIATLSAVAGSPQIFDLLHLYVWPAVLIVAVATYAFAWMQWVGKARDGRRDDGDAHARLLRFALLASLSAALYFALSPWLMSSAVVPALTRSVALSGAGILGALGISATAAGSVLATPRGSFLVTPECVITPLIPLYVAAVFALSLSTARRAAALLVAPAVFYALGVARLLVLALPAFLVPSYALAIHAFSQFLVALLVILVTVFTSAVGSLRERARRAVLAVGVFAVAGVVVGPLWSRAVGAPGALVQDRLLHGAHPYPDPQGALAMLPAFQLALAVALYVAFGRARARLRPAAAAAVLAGFQIALLLMVAESFAHLGLALHVSLIRAIAIVVPVVLVLPLERGLRAQPEPGVEPVTLEQPG